MKYLLDSNTCIVYLRTPLGLVAKKVLSTPSDDIALNVISIVELCRGAHLSAKVAENLAQISSFAAPFRTLALDASAAEVAGRIDAELSNQGQRIGPYDVLIAAIALADDLTLVTHNTREFSRVNGLQLEDWEIAATP
jgi:tRNA(fMet)-specific endonuclease VapC